MHLACFQAFLGPSENRFVNASCPVDVRGRGWGGGGHSRIGWTLVKENIETRAKCVKAIAVFKPEINKV